MHFNFHFTAVEILWTVTFAALLVLLVVLLGRERVRRYPFFTASIVLLALRLLAGRELYGRLSPIALSWIYIPLSLLGGVVGLLVLVEMARRAFRGAARPLWLVNGLGLLAVAGGVVAAVGPWPAWQTLVADSQLAALRLTQLCAQKMELLVSLLTVGLGIAVAVFGRRYQAGWRSHTQRIMIGLSTSALGQLALEAALRTISATANPHTQAELDRLRGLTEKLINANGAVYLAVVLWWIGCLWIDEPGAGSTEGGTPDEGGAGAEEKHP